MCRDGGNGGCGESAPCFVPHSSSPGSFTAVILTISEQPIASSEKLSGRCSGLAIRSSCHGQSVFDP